MCAKTSSIITSRSFSTTGRGKGPTALPALKPSAPNPPPHRILTQSSNTCKHETDTTERVCLGLSTTDLPNNNGEGCAHAKTGRAARPSTTPDLRGCSSPAGPETKKVTATGPFVVALVPAGVGSRVSDLRTLQRRHQSPKRCAGLDGTPRKHRSSHRLIRSETIPSVGATVEPRRCLISYFRTCFICALSGTPCRIVLVSSLHLVFDERTETREQSQHRRPALCPLRKGTRDSGNRTFTTL